MGALLTVRNDGPGDADVTVGGRRFVLRAGEQRLINATHAVKVDAVPPISEAEMAFHMGVSPEKIREGSQPPLRMADSE